MDATARDDIDRVTRNSQTAKPTARNSIVVSENEADEAAVVIDQAK